MNLNEVVESCARTERHNAQARNHSLVIDVVDQESVVLADRQLLRRVICGLVDNAIKYTPDGGTITVSLRNDAKNVLVTITDTGPGILEEDIPHIFEKFYRGHFKVSKEMNGSRSDSFNQASGVGLGLYLARTIIEEIGGQISVHSSVGIGTSFTIMLPVWNGTGTVDWKELSNDKAAVDC